MSMLRVIDAQTARREKKKNKNVKRIGVEKRGGKEGNKGGKEGDKEERGR